MGTRVLFFGTVVLASAMSFAQDSSTPMKPSSRANLMKQCMDLMVKNSEHLSKADLRTACRQQMKAHRDHPNDPGPSTAPLPLLVPPT